MPEPRTVIFLNANDIFPQVSFIMYCECIQNMGLFGHGKKKDVGTKCKVCGVELYEPERLERHLKKAHANVPQSKPDEQGSDGGLW